MSKTAVLALAILSSGIRTSALAWDFTPIAMEAKIHNPKQSYLVLEPIWVEYILHNLTQDTVWVERLYLIGGGTVSFDMIDEKTGKRITRPHSHIHRRFQGKASCTRMSPGDTLRGFYELPMHYSEILRPGNLRLRSMRYKSLLAPDQPPIWRGELEAHIDFAINVKEPTGEEKEALRMFLEARNTKGHRESMLLYSRVVELFPHSVYAAKAQDLVVYCARRLSGSQELLRKEIQKDVERLIELYPDSPYAIDYREGSRVFVQR